MDEIKNGNFPEPRSRQEMYLQDIIGELSKDSSVSEKAYPEPRACLKIKNCTKHLFLSPFYSIIKKKGCSLC